MEKIAKHWPVEACLIRMLQNFAPGFCGPTREQNRLWVLKSDHVLCAVGHTCAVGHIPVCRGSCFCVRWFVYLCRGSYTLCRGSYALCTVGHVGLCRGSCILVWPVYSPLQRCTIYCIFLSYF